MIEPLLIWDLKIKNTKIQEMEKELVGNELGENRKLATETPLGNDHAKWGRTRNISMYIYRYKPIKYLFKNKTHVIFFYSN